MYNKEMNKDQIIKNKKVKSCTTQLMKKRATYLSPYCFP